MIQGRGDGRIKGQLRESRQRTSGTSGSCGSLTDHIQGSMRVVVPTTTDTVDGFAIRITFIDGPRSSFSVSGVLHAVGHSGFLTLLPAHAGKCSYRASRRKWEPKRLKQTSLPRCAATSGLCRGRPLPPRRQSVRYATTVNRKPRSPLLALQSVTSLDKNFEDVRSKRSSF